uniref:Uncharacterized protein n=1 Tax=Onchocerca volvulus TaxID=6282 RepID=A0A8R1XPE6_ONCVO
MFLLFSIMLSDVLSKQTWFISQKAFQNQQLRNASLFTLLSQKASFPERLQTQNRSRNFRKNLLSSAHGSQQQKQILSNMNIIQESISSESISHVWYRSKFLLQNDEQMSQRENDMRHRHLPTTLTVHQKTLNETDKTDVFKHMPFPKSNFSHPLFHKRPNIRQRQERLLELQQSASLKEQSSQPRQFPALTIATFEPKAPVRHFIRKGYRSSDLSRVSQVSKNYGNLSSKLLASIVYENIGNAIKEV